jgi:hypothetical protein
MGQGCPKAFDNMISWPPKMIWGERKEKKRKEKKIPFKLKTKLKEIFSKHHFMEGKVWLGQVPTCSESWGLGFRV